MFYIKSMKQAQSERSTSLFNRELDKVYNAHRLTKISKYLKKLYSLKLANKYLNCFIYQDFSFHEACFSLQIRIKTFFASCPVSN